MDHPQFLKVNFSRGLVNSRKLANDLEPEPGFFWNPHTKCNIDKLEAVHQRATRWITRSDDDYDTRLSKLKVLSLSNRRFTRDVTFFLM